MERGGMSQRTHPAEDEGRKVFISIRRTCGGLLFALQFALQLVGLDPV